MPVIHIGDGKHIEIAEGALSAPPPAPKQKRRSSGRKPTSLPRKDYENKRAKVESISGDNHWSKKNQQIPGYRAWHSLRLSWLHRDPFKTNPGRKLGHIHGIRKEEAERLWAEAREKAAKHMANIKKTINIDDERAEKALLATLELLESPVNQEMKLKAARQILEWTRAKPANKQEVTVNAAEAWLASLATNDEAE